ncbi:shikimate dehydrogenase [Lysinibacter sp. HNR]|uniref:shikimate dehydrogenase n=1 Tax=Lysinibacter sp. HNR TaxID=3031408 RepID=UPI002435BE3B|nr:shikimate dehydrogenase [Lysinibacter sp. HNR]WGD36294.1 shikimate dehydrogenase [Lysinibacter sp. HNR]
MGSPIGHSLSPRIHNAAYSVLGLPWNYFATECTQPELEGFLATTQWNAVSLTMPLKKTAFDFLSARNSYIDSISRESGVVNTLARENSGAPWRGYNTDVSGLRLALSEKIGRDFSRVTVLGGGATAVSALLAVAGLGATRVTFRVRTPSKVENLVALGERHGVSVAAESLGGAWQESDLVISTVPGVQAAELSAPDWVRQNTPLYDVAYDPWPSPLATLWSQSGKSASSGLSMLLQQALLQIRIFVLGDPDATLPSEADVFRAMQEAVANL